MLKKTGCRIPATPALALVALTHRSQAEVLSDLAPGSSYILVFVTSDTIDATSSTIGDYKAFGTIEAHLTAALAALGTSWPVIGSTLSTNAVANIGSNPGIPIFDVNGNEIAAADTTSGLFSGSLLNPISPEIVRGAQAGQAVWPVYAITDDRRNRLSCLITKWH